MKTSFRQFGEAFLWLLFILCLLLPDFVSAQVSMSNDVVSYEQNFDALPASDSAVWENGTEYPAMPGWYIQRTKTDNHIVTYNGSGNTGGLYSFGNGKATERALGSMSSFKKGEFAWGLLLQNNTGDTITQLNVDFYGEQWRISNKTAPQHQIAFFYAISNNATAFNLSPKSDQNWTSYAALNFKSPHFKPEIGKSIDGNAAENRQLMSASIPVKIPDGAYVMLRWKDADETEADHGLAIDDFHMSWATSSLRILPVDLISFTARPEGNNVNLAWETATEEQNSFFEIERSPKGRQFESLGQVSGNGTTAMRSKYTFLDEAPLAGASYYRLKQTDEDGSYTYSAAVSVTRAAAERVALVYPTITSQVLNIDREGQTEMQRAIVIDMRGKVVLQQKLPDDAAQQVVDVSSLRSGSYMLVLLGNKGERIASRFIKQ